MLALQIDTILGLPLDATLTLRLTKFERDLWDEEARVLGLSTSKYVRTMLANEEAKRKLAVLIRRQNERKEYVRLLRGIGQSRIANNLNQLAYAANTGSLAFTPDVVSKINEAYDAVMYMRSLLIEMSGVR